MIGEVARVTARQLLGRRRMIVLVLLAAVPIALAGLLRVVGPTGSQRPDELIEGVFVGLIVTVLLPLVAVVLGTTAFGAEIEDGTVVYLLTKPVRRGAVVLAKWTVAASIAVALVTGATVISGFVGLAGTRAWPGTVAGYGIAVAAGSVVYVSVFVALSLVTSRALIVGLVYVIAWEGALADWFPGVRFLSIRQYTLAIADAAGADGRAAGDTLDPLVAVLLACVVVVVALAVAVRRLQDFEIPEAD